MRAPGLTFIEGEVRMPIMTLPIRTIVVELADARLLLSPASTLSATQHRELGEITDIVAPSLLHTTGMVAAAQAHPGARLWGPPGAAEKRPTLEWHGILGRDRWPFEPTLGVTELAGMPTVREHVFLHRPSRSLLVTDLVFHIVAPRGLGAWLVLKLFGTHARFGVSRLFLKLVKDRAAFQAALATIAALDFENLVPAHGSIVEGHARPRLLAALEERGYRAG